MQSTSQRRFIALVSAVLLAVTAQSCSAPSAVETEDDDSRTGDVHLDARVAFEVGGMMKAKSGAT